MARTSMRPEHRRALMQAALLDGVCVLGGVALFLATGNWLWLVAGLLLGAGFLLPALIRIMRAQR